MVWLNKLLILLAFVVFSAGSAWAVPTIEAIGGSDTVSVKRDGKELKLKKGDELKVGDEVTTGKNNAVDLRFDDKTLIRVGANSQYKLEEDSKKLFHRFFSGIIRVLVPPKKDGSDMRFRLNTPEGTIGVRGTEFVVIRSADQTTLKGLEGEVLFGKADQGFSDLSAFILVRKGYESSVKKGGVPSEPKSFSLPSFLKEIEAKNNDAFGALADRTSGKTKARTEMVAPAAAPVSKSLGMAVAKKAEPAKPPVRKIEKNKAEEDVNELLVDAAGRGELKAMESLIKRGANVNYQDEHGIGPLAVASSANKMDSVKLLFQNGANPNIKDKEGNTPLMGVALVTGDAAMAYLLLKNKAELNEKNNNGLTALDIAVTKSKEDPKKYEDIIPVLKGEINAKEDE